MALVNTEILRAILPNIGLPVNADGTYRIGVEDVNSDEILVAVAAAAIDLAAIEVINTAIQAAVEAILLDTADIETATEAINTALQAGGISQLQFAAMVTALGNIQTAVQIMDDWDEANRAKVNPIAGQAGIAANAGVMDALTTRVTIATDDTHFGAVGAASDIDGVLHAQQRYIADRVEAIENTDGAVADAVVAAGAVGTLSAKLRRATQGLEDLKTMITLAANDGVDIGDVTINNAAAAAAVNIQDGGNIISTDIADGSDVAQGAVADAVVVAGAAGTLSAKLRRLTADIGGILTVEGTTADALVAAGAVGTISAKLRRATQGLEDLKTLITLAANSGVDIGDVTINNAAGAAAVNIQDGGNVVSTDVADGGDATQGAIADAAVAAGAAGTVSAKLRRFTTDLATLVTAVEAQGEGDYTTPTHTWPVIGAGTTVALAANANRLYAMFVNDGTEPIYLKFGVAAVTNQGTRLNAAGGSYEMSREIGNLYVGAINGICASGGMTLLVTEGV